MDKSVVIGANGFIGSHLTDALVAKGHDVRAFDRFRGSGPAFLAEPVEVLSGEFLSRSDLEAAVAGMDNVFHFLSTTTPVTAENDPTLDIRTNVAQTVELLEVAVAANVKHVYFASTGGAIYGPQGKSDYLETDRALPISPYGIGKLTIEHYLHYFRMKHGLQSTIFRISNPYGTRQRANRKQGLIPIALRQIANGETVTQLGDGSMVRDYVFVTDVVKMITTLVDSQTRYDLYNLGSGVGYSVAEVLSVMRRVTGTDFEIRSQEAPATFVDRVVLNMERFRSEFGEPSITRLDEGVRQTWDELRGQTE